MNIISQYLQDIGNFPLLSAEEEQDLARQMKDPDPKVAAAAKDYFINCNLRLVVNIAKEYKNYHMELLDLVSEGNAGLMVAAEKFDPDLGYRFSTCATPWIKQAITKAIIDKGKNIRLPAHIYQLINKYKKAVAELSMSGNDFTITDIAAKMGVSEEKVKDLEQWKNDAVSLSTPLGDDSDDTLEDLQPDFSESPWEYTERLAKRAIIDNLIANLKPRTQLIMKMRFGLGTKDDPEDYRNEHTFEEIGEVVHLSRERVRQIVNETLRDLRTKWDGQA